LKSDLTAVWMADNLVGERDPQMADSKVGE